MEAVSMGDTDSPISPAVSPGAHPYFCFHIHKQVVKIILSLLPTLDSGHLLDGYVGVHVRLCTDKG